MKKLTLIALVALIAGFACASDYVTKVVTPGTNNVATIRGEANATLIPIAIMQDIVGTETNTATSAVVVNGVTFTQPALAAKVGGSETPQILNSETNATAPIAITSDAVWTLTGVGTAYSNITYGVVFERIAK